MNEIRYNDNNDAVKNPSYDPSNPDSSEYTPLTVASNDVSVYTDKKIPLSVWDPGDRPKRLHFISDNLIIYHELLKLAKAIADNKDQDNKLAENINAMVKQTLDRIEEAQKINSDTLRDVNTNYETISDKLKEVTTDIARHDKSLSGNDELIRRLIDDLARFSFDHKIADIRYDAKTGNVNVIRYTYNADDPNDRNSFEDITLVNLKSIVHGGSTEVFRTELNNAIREIFKIPEGQTPDFITHEKLDEKIKEVKTELSTPLNNIETTIDNKILEYDKNFITFDSTKLDGVVLPTDLKPLKLNYNDLKESYLNYVKKNIIIPTVTIPTIQQNAIDSYIAKKSTNLESFKQDLKGVNTTNTDEIVDNAINKGDIPNLLINATTANETLNSELVLPWSVKQLKDFVTSTPIKTAIQDGFTLNPNVIKTAIEKEVGDNSSPTVAAIKTLINNNGDAPVNVDKTLETPTSPEYERKSTFAINDVKKLIDRYTPPQTQHSVITPDLSDDIGLVSSNTIKDIINNNINATEITPLPAESGSTTDGFKFRYQNPLRSDDSADRSFTIPKATDDTFGVVTNDIIKAMATEVFDARIRPATNRDIFGEGNYIGTSDDGIANYIIETPEATENVKGKMSINDVKNIVLEILHGANPIVSNIEVVNTDDDVSLDIYYYNRGREKANQKIIDKDKTHYTTMEEVRHELSGYEPRNEINTIIRRTDLADYTTTDAMRSYVDSVIQQLKTELNK